nr:stage III sporulation protein AD [Eubacterium sp.]
MGKIAWIAIAGMTLSVMVGSVKRDIAIWISIMTGIVILFLGLQQFETIVILLTGLTEKIGIGESYIRIILKMLGIAYLTEFTASICRDAGQNLIAGQVDFFGRVSMILVSIPVLEALLETIAKLF